MKMDGAFEVSQASCLTETIRDDCLTILLK